MTDDGELGSMGVRELGGFENEELGIRNWGKALCFGLIVELMNR